MMMMIMVPAVLACADNQKQRGGDGRFLDNNHGFNY